jgi:hypothetical protein
MHDELWAGVHSKLEAAQSHFEGMGRSLEPPPRTQTNVALEASGAILDTRWQETFYAELDAFLSATRSVAQVIKCCFGVDQGHPEMRAWFNTLRAEEQDRRRDFWRQFQATYNAFSDLPLSRARNTSEHRAGYPPVEVTISGMFGTRYVGSPTQRVPISETQPLEPEHAWMATHIPIRPRWSEFRIGEEELFTACQRYIEDAQRLVAKARCISDQVHGTHDLTQPPN